MSDITHEDNMLCFSRIVVNNCIKNNKALY